MKMEFEEKITLIALNIKRLRVAKKMSVQELAYRCDIERSNMSRIESARTNLTIKTMCRICTALDVDLQELLRGANPPI